MSLLVVGSVAGLMPWRRRTARWDRMAPRRRGDVFCRGREFLYPCESCGNRRDRFYREKDAFDF